MIKKMMILMLALGIAGQFASADVYEDLASYTYAKDQNAAEKPLQAMLKAPVAEHAAIEAKLIAVIAKPDATQDGKAWACRYLQIVGTDASVPALSGLLKDEILSDYARLALERMVGSKAASAALRDALSKAPAQAKVGILASLGEMRDVQAVKAIAALTGSSDKAVAISAITALGKIADENAVKALQKIQTKPETKQATLDAMIQAAKTSGGSAARPLYEAAYASDSIQHRIAGMVGIATVDASKGIELLVAAIKGEDEKLRSGALTAATEIEGKALTGALVEILDGLDVTTQARLICVLGARGDAIALSKVLGYLKSEDRKVSEQATKAVVKLGNADAAAAMLSMASKGENTEVLIKTVAGMVDQGVDAAIISALAKPELRIVALKTAAERRISGARRAILDCVKDSDSKVQEEAWKALGEIGGAELIDPMTAAAVIVKDEAMQRKAFDAVLRVFSAESDPAKAFEAVLKYYGKASLKGKQKILEMAAMAGSPAALECTTGALKSGDESLIDSAVRSLAGWRNENAADALLDISKSSSSEVHRILALRGYIRIAGQRGGKLSGDQRVAMLKNAGTVAKRPDEKKQIIGGLRGQHNQKSLELLMGYLADDALINETADAVMEVAGRIERHHKEASINALEALVKRLDAVGTDKGRIKRATDMLNRMRPKK